MAGFSGALKIGDLNDFIAPSQACVVSLNGNKIGQAVEDEVGSVQIQRPAGFPQTTGAGAGEAVKVSLHDCLACSGCVTSAETVLLQHQSVEEFVARLADPTTTVIVSLSPQSMVSLAAAYGMPPAECVAKVTAVLKSQGVMAVFDVGWARDIALLEAASEFVDRWQQRRASQNGGAVQTCTTAAYGSGPALPSQQTSALPMLASACPGWVCYAEKTHGNFVLPHISTAKSPQAVLGTLVKRQWAPAAGLEASRVYHCTVMPCYDKKLEASRDDFVVPTHSGGLVEPPTPETDCVLATTELHDWLQSLPGVDLRAALAVPLDAPFSNQVPAGGGRSFGGAGGSGGYMEHVFRVAAWELFGQKLPPGPLPTVQGRNADVCEVSLVVEGRRVLHFAAAYGFRNIQGLMRKIKSGRCEYDYVEVMACPSGCLNGGGQVKPAPGQSAHQLIEQLETAYHGGDYLEQRSPQQNPSVAALYRDWVSGCPGSAPARQLFHTQYHRREKNLASAIADW